MQKFVSIVVAVLVLALTGLMFAYTTNPVFASTAETVLAKVIYADPAEMTNGEISKEFNALSKTDGSNPLSEIRWTVLQAEEYKRGMIRKAEGVDFYKLAQHVFPHQVTVKKLTEHVGHDWELEFIHPKTGKEVTATLDRKPATANEGGDLTAYLCFIDGPSTGLWIVDTRKIDLMKPAEAI